MPDPATATPAENPSCREAVEVTFGVITAAAQQEVGDLGSFATEEDLDEALGGLLFSLPEEAGVDLDLVKGCGTNTASAAEVKRGLEQVLRSEPEPVADVTVALLAIPCSDDPLFGLDGTSGDDVAFVNEVCPVVVDYFERRFPG